MGTGLDTLARWAVPAVRYVASSSLPGAAPHIGQQKGESFLRRPVRGASVREDGISPVAEKRDRSPDTLRRKAASEVLG